ncbi:MAG: acetate--CoA ligase family protein [Nanoarchaeota archaeon]|nr:acetate--CoA ligase family protein [Nanoarchaeota archaeon]
MLSLLESFDKLKALPLARHLIIKNEGDLNKIEFPYWLKADISEHKLELGAVVKCNNLSQAKENLKEMRKKFPASSIIAQEQIEGIEMIIGLKQDKAFGKLLLVGFGGTFAETIKDTSFRALPISNKEIEKQISELKLCKVLVSRKKFAIDKFISLAEKISKLDINEADFNPIILNEKGAFIVDARIEV